jgi:formylmethanofuran dehydrogenase subunit E
MLTNRQRIKAEREYWFWKEGKDTPIRNEFNVFVEERNATKDSGICLRCGERTLKVDMNVDGLCSGCAETVNYDKTVGQQ